MRLRPKGRARVLVVVLAALAHRHTGCRRSDELVWVRAAVVLSAELPDARSRASAGEHEPASVAAGRGPARGPPWGLRLDTQPAMTCASSSGASRMASLDHWASTPPGMTTTNSTDSQPTFDGGWGQQCGTTDQAGNAFLNVEWGGIAASANPITSTRGANTGGCQTPGIYAVKTSTPCRKRPRPGTGASPGTCPPGTSRTVFIGLLGPDATNITDQDADRIPANREDERQRRCISTRVPADPEDLQPLHPRPHRRARTMR